MCFALQGLPSAYKLYYSYDPVSMTVSGAFEYPNPEGWVAFGVNPDNPGLMLGGSALVVKSDASATSGMLPMMQNADSLAVKRSCR